MMSVVCVIVLLTFFASPSFGAVSGGFFNNPKNPGKCTIDDNVVLSPGDIVKYPEHECRRVICGANSFAEFQTCGVQSHVGCTQGDYIDKSRPYPECCERHLICNKTGKTVL